MPLRLATSITRVATSRTWPTVPAAPLRSAAVSVCTESITQTSGRAASSTARRRVEVRLREDRDVERSGRGSLLEPLGSQPDLRRGLLAADVQRRAARALEQAERHRRERRLADPRRAAEQDQRAGNEAPAEQAIQLADPGLKARRAVGGDVAQAQRLGRSRGAGARGDAGTRELARGRALLGERVPLRARRALSVPLRVSVPAGGADEDRFRSRHRPSVGAAADGFARRARSPPQPCARSARFGATCVAGAGRHRRMQRARSAPSRAGAGGGKGIGCRR